MNEIINGLLQRKQRDGGVDVNDKNAVLKTIDIPIAFIPAGKYIKYYKLCLLDVPCSFHNVFVVSVFSFYDSDVLPFAYLLPKTFILFDFTILSLPYDGNFRSVLCVLS